MCAIDEDPTQVYVCTLPTRKLLSDQVEIGKDIELVLHCSVMSKRKVNPKWDDYKKKTSNKRRGKHEKGSCSGTFDYITVQRLSSSIEGKCQKYSRIRALTLVPLGWEPILSNIKMACTDHFNLQEMECNLLASKRWPSFTNINMITNWKVLHIRFIPTSNEVCDPLRGLLKTGNANTASPVKSDEVRQPQALAVPSKIAASVRLSAILQIGKLIKPKVDTVSVEVEQFDLKVREWLPLFEVKLSLNKEKFASGAFRDAYEVISGRLQPEES